MVDGIVELGDGYATHDTDEYFALQRLLHPTLCEHGAVDARLDTENDDVAALYSEHILVGNGGHRLVVGEFMG